MTINQLIQEQLKEAQKVLENFLNNPENISRIADAAEMLATAFGKNKKVISCGNGGSHCDAMHFAEELTGRFRDNRQALPAISISDPSHLSCVGNDFGYDYVFSRFIEGLGQEGDVLFCLSTSGNSQNVVEAVNAARGKGMKVIALTGKDGGKLANQADIEIRVPHFGYADRIQEIHIKIIHSIILSVEELIN